MTVELLLDGVFPPPTVSDGGTTNPAQGTVEAWTVSSSVGFTGVTTGVAQLRIYDPQQPSEVMLLTNVADPVWTVTRGFEGTTPVPHAAGFSVYPCLTAGAMSAVLAAAVATAESLAESTAASTAAGLVATETTRATTAEALLAPKASPALTGNPTAPTQSPGNNSTRVATTAYADAAIVAQHTTDNGTYESFINVSNSVGDVAAIQAAIAAKTSGGVVNGSFQTGSGQVARITTPTVISLGYTNTVASDWTVARPQKVKIAFDIIPDPGLGSALTIKGGYGYEVDINILGGGASATVTDAATTSRTTSADGTMTVGSTTLSSASASFTSADKGTWLQVPGAGTAGVALWAQVSSVTSSTAVVLTAPCVTAVTTASVVIYSLTITSANAIAGGLAVGAVVFLQGAGQNPEGVRQPLAVLVRSVSGNTFTVSEGPQAVVSGATMQWWDAGVTLADGVGAKVNIYASGAFLGYALVSDARDNAANLLAGGADGRKEFDQCGGGIFWAGQTEYGNLGTIIDQSKNGSYFGQCADLHMYWEGGVGQPSAQTANNYAWFDRCSESDWVDCVAGDRAIESLFKITAATDGTGGTFGRGHFRGTVYQAQGTGNASTSSNQNQLTGVINGVRTFRVGQLIWGPGIAEGTTITAVSAAGPGSVGNGWTSGSPGTITLSQNVTANETAATYYGLTCDVLKMIGVSNIELTGMSTHSIAGIRVIGGGGNGITGEWLSESSDYNSVVLTPGNSGIVPQFEIDVKSHFALFYMMDIGALPAGTYVKLLGRGDTMHAAAGAAGLYAIRCSATAGNVTVDTTAGFHQTARASLSGLMDPTVVNWWGQAGAKAGNNIPASGKAYVTDGNGDFTLSTVAVGAVVERFVQTSAVVVANTVTDTLVAGPYTIPANSATTGSTFRMTVWGNVTTGTNAETCTMRFRIGGVAGASFGTFTLVSAASKTASAFRAQVEFTVLGVPSTTTPITMGGYAYSQGTGTNTAYTGVPQNVNTTVSKDIVADVTWGGADASASVTIQGAIIEQIA